MVILSKKSAGPSFRLSIYPLSSSSRNPVTTGLNLMLVLKTWKPPTQTKFIMLKSLKSMCSCICTYFKLYLHIGPFIVKQQNEIQSKDHYGHSKPLHFVYFYYFIDLLWKLLNWISQSYFTYYIDDTRFNLQTSLRRQKPM